MKKELTSYLKNLRFDTKLYNTIQAKIVTNFRLVFLLIAAIVGIGLINFFDIPRRLNPEVKIPIVTVTTILPGASPKDVESLVTIPLEDKINGVKGLDTVTSASRENVSIIVLQFLSSVSAEKAKTDVDSLVSQVTNLPTEAKTPLVKTVDFEDQPVWNFVLTANDNDYPSLMRFSRILKNNLENDPKIDRVLTPGLDERRIEINLDPEKIRQYGINPAILAQTVSKATSSFPAGNIKTTGNTFSLAIDPEIVNIDDLRRIQISLPNGTGQTVSLGDIATISDMPIANLQKSYFADGKTSARPAVQFFIYKITSANIDAAEKAMKKVVNDTTQNYPSRFTVTNVLNTAERIDKQFVELGGEIRSTIILVFINLLIFLGLRQAIISSLTIPLTFLSAISIINILGYTLNFLTLFSFLLALGLLIDDTIVTVTAMTRYHATGRFTGKETGLLVWKDFIVPLWSTTITTIWAFVPLLITSGIIGEFIKPLPVVVTATMLSSTSIAVLITLPLMMIVLQPQLPQRVKTLLKICALLGVAILGFFIIPKSVLFPLVYAVYLTFLFVAYQVRKTLAERSRKAIGRQPAFDILLAKIASINRNGLINTEKLSFHYMRFIDRIIGSKSGRRKTLIMVLLFAIAGYILIPLGFVTNEFFPKTDQDAFYVSVELPAGTNSSTVNTEAISWLERLRHTRLTEKVVAETGAQLGSNLSRTDNPSSFIVTVTLIPKEKRTVQSSAIAQEIRDKYRRYQKGNLLVQELTSGPPAGADIQIKLLGDDLGKLDVYSDKIIAYLNKQAGIANVQKSVKAGTSKIVFKPDLKKLADAGITIDAVGLWLRTAASGFTMDTLRVNEKDTDIVFTSSPVEKSPEDLGSLTIANTKGDTYPLLSLGYLSLENNPTIINREGGKRTISVTASVLPGHPVTAKNSQLEKFASTLELPAGYNWKTGGVNEENQKSINSMLRAMSLSFILILITMVLEFNSFRQAFIALTTIPLAVAGVFYLFAISGTPLSFPALIGILSLFGIEVTTVIVIVEKINDNLKEGFSLRESVVEAAGSRLEPIILTSITSVLGLIPITVADPLWRGLGGAIIAGLLIGGFVKLFYVPIMYYVFYRGEKK